MSDDSEPDGAVDHTFDDAERDPREQIVDKLATYNRDLRPTDIAIDVVQGRPVFIKKQAAATAADYFAREDFDVATYKTNPFLPVRPDDPVLTAVYVPTKAQDVPSERKGNRTYDFPRGRLMRVPIEWLWDGDVTPFDHVLRAVLATVFDVARDDHRPAVLATVTEAYGGGVVADAIERAGYDPDQYAEDGVDALHSDDTGGNDYDDRLGEFE